MTNFRKSWTAKDLVTPFLPTGALIQVRVTAKVQVFRTGVCKYTINGQEYSMTLNNSNTQTKTVGYSPQNVRVTATVTEDLGTGNAQDLSIKILNNTTPVAEGVLLNNTTPELTGHVNLMLVGKETTPTYLETLDKLDQWSRAQYIPDSENRLNI